MKYCSTRDSSRLFSLKEAVFMGLAPDGGLFVPQYIPKADMERVIDFSDYASMATYLSSLFLEDEVDSGELSLVLKKRYTFSPHLVKIGDTYTLELFDGPTFAFKDYGAGFMASVLGLMNKSKERLTILTATSGDTGSAVANGFYSVPGIDVVILYPKGKVSPLQESQMTTLGGNVHCLKVEGNFDDCQRMVKEVFSDLDFRKDFNISSANSINILRWLPQAFYYFWGYKAWRQAENKDRIPVICVPSGNYGNLSSGMLARRMGLPVERFIAASNANDVIPKFLKTGEYRPGPSVRTLANAMDVGTPSNYERMVWLEKTSGESLKEELLGFSLDDEGIKRTIKDLYDDFSYVSCPHSAVGYAAMKHYDQEGFYLSTAHPAKFMEVISPVIGNKVDLPQALKALSVKNKEFRLISNDSRQVEEFIASLA